MLIQDVFMRSKLTRHSTYSCSMFRGDCYSQDTLNSYTACFEEIVTHKALYILLQHVSREVPLTRHSTYSSSMFREKYHSQSTRHAHTTYFKEIATYKALCILMQHVSGRLQLIRHSTYSYSTFLGDYHSQGNLHQTVLRGEGHSQGNLYAHTACLDEIACHSQGPLHTHPACLLKIVTHKVSCSHPACFKESTTEQALEILTQHVSRRMLLTRHYSYYSSMFRVDRHTQGYFLLKVVDS